MITGDDLRRVRLRQRVTLGQLARMIGRDKGHLSRVETGTDRAPTPALVRDYETALGVRIAVAVDGFTEGSATSTQLPDLRSRAGRREPDVDVEASPAPASTADLVSRLTKEDLALDRREAARMIAGLLLGAPLLERVEGWLAADEPPPPRRRSIGIGYQEVDQIEQVAWIFRAWDNQFGGGLRRKAVVGQLAEVADELRDFSHPRS